MRTLTTVTFGLVLAAFALSAVPAWALETTPAAPAVSSAVTKVSERCERWAHRCSELHPAHGWRFRRCMMLHGCRG